MKYEYRFEAVNLNTGKRVHEEEINKAGQEGWEVVNIWSEERVKGEMIQRMLLKRPIPGSEGDKPTYTMIIKQGLFGRRTSVKKGNP